ncbi:MAG: hypothetical protein IJ874_07475 [Ruminococcus sp.]|nr:hypothetical protein [Ruminococcus sp.]
MNDVTELCSREACPVAIGDITLWCDSFRIVNDSVYYEQPSADGDNVLTNRYRRSPRVTLSGRVYCGDEMPAMLAALVAMVGASAGFDTEYRGLSLTSCRVQSCTAEDGGGEFLDVAAVLAVFGGISVAESEE